MKLKKADERCHPRSSGACWEAPGCPLWRALPPGQKRSPPKTRLSRAGTDIERPSGPAGGLPPGPDGHEAAGAGLERNIEMGLLVDSPALAQQILGHWQALIQGGYIHLAHSPDD